MFEKFWDKRRSENIGEPKYISLCYILEGSGEDKNVIETIFDSHLIEGEDFDAKERKEMIGYLYQIAEDK